MNTTQDKPTPRSAAWLFPIALAASVSLSSCAAFNKGQFVLARNVTFGRELIDLKRAKDDGAITEAEYNTIKAKIMELVEQSDGEGVFTDFTYGNSDPSHDHDHDGDKTDD